MDKKQIRLKFQYTTEMLKQKIKDKTAVVAVLGLGHVGYPMASLFAKNGFQTIGYDINRKRLSDIKEGKVVSELSSILPTDETKKQKTLAEIAKNMNVSNTEEDLKNADVFVVDVPTPLKDNETPNLLFLTNTCTAITKYLRKETLVIVESTIYPGATEEIVKPLLEESGLHAGDDFYLSFSPERIDPGNKKWSLEKIPKIVGGINKDSVDAASLLFSQIMEKVVPVSSLQVAEATKMLENIFRSVNIALVNDLSKFFEKMGIDTWETVAAASTKPFGFLPHYPGPGVGGHCIPKDPFYLLYKARKMGTSVEFIEQAACINRNMPLYVVHLAEEALNRRNKNIRDSSFAVLGVTYKRDVLDIRRTPSKTVITELCKASKNVMAFDPLTDETFGAKTGSLEETIKGKDCVIVLVNHSYFRENSIEDKINELSPNCCVIDARNFIDSTKLKNSIHYRCLGKPLKSG
ncbi:MAG: UDP-N-acetyl-D-glucosamine dehydrogenase [Candidatus Bathyarchaeum sp.]|nr:MAG: UDP-N-acetyl-D-glucosamine dehydrogenase [Candidatus Bathyarchaeum sp.]